jgi:hypothetical protein
MLSRLIANRTEQLRRLVTVYIVTNQNIKWISNSLQIFVNRCLRRILNVKCLHKISYEELWHRTKKTPTEQQKKERKWRWIDHTLRKPQGAIERHALDWNPGTRKRGTPRTTWKRTTEGKMQKVGKS